MANLKNLKKRIRLVKNIAKVTKAMQVAAALKMKKAQETALSSRLFSQKLNEMAALVTLESVKPINENIDLILVGPDRGLCGALLSNLQKGLENWVRENGKERIRVICINKKSLIIANRLGLNVTGVFDISVSKADQKELMAVSQMVREDITNKKAGYCVVGYIHYKNLMSQGFAWKQIIPMETEKEKVDQEILIEPDKEKVYNSLVPRSMRFKLYQAILETAASEFSARAMAMKAASDNASDIATYLTSQYNKNRQATITAQIAEVVGTNLSS